MQPAARPWTLSVYGILLALGALVALSWAALVRQPDALMPSTMAMSGLDALEGDAAVLPFGGLLFVPMWTVMMIAMMFPTAAPMLAFYARTQAAGPATAGNTLGFASGYLFLWALFGTAAFLLVLFADAALDIARPLRGTSAYVQATILILAGAYQWTPLKRICLTHCQNPVTFLFHHWRPGVLGPFRMGLGHGVYCIGCCWGEMAVLFIVGVMSLPWMAVLTLFIFLEKVTKPGIVLARIAGTAAAAYGVFLLASAIANAAGG